MKRVKITKAPLSTEPVREFTDRECCAIVGGLLGGLVRHAGVDTVRNAINWWAATPEAWDAFSAAAYGAMDAEAEARVRAMLGMPTDKN